VANFVYNIAKKQLLDGDIDFNAPDDIRILLLQAATDEDPDDVNVQAVLARAGTTELTSTGYTRQALANEATSQDDPNDRAEFTSDPITFTAVSQLAAEVVIGWVIFKFITNDANSIPIMFVDSATGLPLTPNGSDITITPNAEGLLQLI
jgi:hypothetical protein